MAPLLTKLQRAWVAPLLPHPRRYLQRSLPRADGGDPTAARSLVWEQHNPARPGRLTARVATITRSDWHRLRHKSLTKVQGEA